MAKHERKKGFKKMKFHTSCCRAPKGNGNLKMQVENTLVNKKYDKSKEKKITLHL